MNKKRVVAIIPARMGASRFPGKPLAMIGDLPMIEHVRRRVLLSEAIDEVYVATCDDEIYDTVRNSNGNVIMTKDTHERCTDRVEEAAQKIDLDICVLVQGDEPLFLPQILGELVQPMLNDPSIGCANLISRIKDKNDLLDEDIVKTVLNENEFILYFSRSPIPYLRVQNECPLYRQTGVSAFTKKFLTTYATLKPTKLEEAESIDFLRIVGNGYPIKAVIYDQVTLGVDRPDDVGKIEKVLANDSEQREMYERILSL